ncbi:MAG: RnfABCDGE type electron transport complex subunit D, partial [Phycisphaerae bacterium]|nr:RnfABCDGE type electron transport complex subunit D [Phycisphaerae bacterium]
MAKETHLHVGPTPHVSAPLTTSRMMADVLIALIPVALVAAILVGWNALRVGALCVGTCVATEMI